MLHLFDQFLKSFHSSLSSSEWERKPARRVSSAKKHRRKVASAKRRRIAR